MLNVNNNVTLRKRDVLSQIVAMQFAGKLESDIDSIPQQIVPDGAAPVRGSIEEDRQAVKMRVLADLGISVETADMSKPLADYAKEALLREKPTWPVMTMMSASCHGCKPTHFFPTDLCQGCEARPCMVNCPKKAIEIVDHRARIDQSKCIKCGICAQNCPYHAIVKFTVPCEEACPVGAITKDAEGREHIDFEKCVFCGACMRECPFGAMQAKSQLVDVVKHIMAGKRVVAMYAPAIGAQFKAQPGQLEGALLAAGFSKVWEVAIGADLTADAEAKEYEERMEEGAKMMTTSCCPAWVRLAQIHVPDIVPAISSTGSPMNFNGILAKKDDPDCVTVFIGPCLAKRREGFDDKNIDYVLTVDEVDALFAARSIDITKMEAKPGKYLPTVSGRNFAKTGGVAESVRLRLSDHGREILKPYIVNGMTKAVVKQLQTWGKMFKGEIPMAADAPNLIEVMCCEGGCIAGPGIITKPQMGNGLLMKYANAGSAPGGDGKPVACDMDAVIAGEKA
ncbi:MAG: monomeric [FeFe] hydrogenase [Treponema sp.]|nr:monomeric [FeFe] hydrogenase [Treponema sp.]